MKNKEAETTTRKRTIPPDFEAMARNVFIENLKMNAAKKTHDGLRSTLFAQLENQRIKGFRTDGTDLSGKPVMIDVDVATPMVDVISVPKLLRTSFPEIAKFLDGLPEAEQKRFYGMLSATKKSVEAHAGTIVVTQAVEVVPGTRNVFVKAAK